LLGMLETAGVVKLDQVMHDGTKIRAQAGVDTFRREGKLRENLEKARRVVEQMGDPDAEETARQRAARQRARTERVERLEQALAELQQLKARQDSDEKKPEGRVSLTEPEARMMKHGDNAITPAYNAQISTDAEKKAIVGAHLSQCSSDSGSLLPAMEVIRQNLGRDPRQGVADGGFTNRDTRAAMKEREIDFIGALRQRRGEMEQAGSGLFILQLSVVSNSERKRHRLRPLRFRVHIYLPAALVPVGRRTILLQLLRERFSPRAVRGIMHLTQNREPSYAWGRRDRPIPSTIDLHVRMSSRAPRPLGC